MIHSGIIFAFCSHAAELADLVLPAAMWVEINPQDARELKPGHLFIPFHYNILTVAAFDPISREPNYKQAAVRIERAGVIL